MRTRFKNFQVRHDREEKVNPKLTTHQIELAQVEAEIEKLLDTLTGANATLLAYANKKIEELDTRRQTISKAIAELSVETMSPQKEQELLFYLLYASEPNHSCVKCEDGEKPKILTYSVYLQLH